MSTTWKSTSKETNNNTYTGATLSSWSRQQKLAMIASFVILGILLGMSACSKQSSKPALVAVSGPQSPAVPNATTSTATTTAIASTTPAAPKKVHKKRPTVVTYSDANSGVSFVYPRKYELASGAKVQAQLADMGAPMNFVQPGGVAVATVTLPGASYPGTDFNSAFFDVNVNRSLSEQECSHFALADKRKADGAPADAEKVTIGSKDMEMTSDFSANAVKQAEAKYYHSYENGACYEFVLGLGTAGYGTADGIEPVDREEVFKKLEKILASVKIQAVEQEHVAAKAVENREPAK